MKKNHNTNYVKKKKNYLSFLVKYLVISLLIVNTYSIYAKDNDRKEIIVKNNIIGKVNYKTFTLLNDEKINISGIAHALKEVKFSEPTFYGWILDSKTRKVVWNLLEESEKNSSSTLKIENNVNIKDNNNDNEKSKYQNFEDEVFLKKGIYELYYVGMYKGNDISISFSEAITEFGDLIDKISLIVEMNENNKLKNKIFIGRGHSTEYNDELNIKISGNKKNIKQLGKDEFVNNMIDEAIVSIIRTGDDKNLSKGFTLLNETELSIYSIGEVKKSGGYDYSRITNIDNYETVWSLNYKNENLKPAGGGDKNRFVKENITLPAGNYMVHFNTDDSHSFEGWNVLPPNDPQFWGITIWAANQKDKKNITKFDKSKIKKPIIEITKVGNYADEQVGFTLSKKCKITILALGEGNSQMVDFPKIIDADSRETIWKMQRKNTEHAGGASKNRKIVKSLELEKGNYIVIYRSDDSHSFNDWNSSPPYEVDKWGITIWSDDKLMKPSKIKKFNPDNYKSKDIICQILRVKNDRYISKSFKLDKDTKLRVTALGEGYKPDLADFGWIENDLNGQIVWEMTYRKTKHAGGAKKNRSFNGIVMLPKGEYNLIYKTDDSHAYNDWNTTPPDDADRYGIILMKE